MKRLLLLAILALVVFCPAVTAQMSFVKTTFQEYNVITAWPTIQGDWVFTRSSPGVSVNVQTDTYGHKSVLVQHNGAQDAYIYSAGSEVFTYAGATGFGNGGVYIQNAGAAHTKLWSGLPAGRIEVRVIGGTASLYIDGALVSSDAGWAANPNFIEFTATVGGFGAVDDIVLGEVTDATIVGSLPNNYFILYDSTAPASTGLYQSNSPAAPTLINSNFFGASYGRPMGSAATNLLIKNPSGNLVKSYPVNNQSCECILPIADLYVGGSIQNGRWSVELEDAPTSVSYFWVYAEGAVVSWDQSTYAPGDGASITYSISAGRWNPATSTYSLKIMDVYGNVIDTQSITTQTGLKTYSWQTTDPLGVYYAEVIQTDIATSVDTLLNYDTTTLQGTFGFRGTVLDAETATPLQGANVNFTQLGTPRVSLSAFNGAYNATNFVTGGATIVNITKAIQYVQYLNTITPTTARNIDLNLSLLSTNPAKSGATIGGIFRSNTYGEPIPGVTVTATNGSTVYTTTTNNAGYYVFTGLVNGTCYRIMGSKTGYSMPVSNPTGSLKCAGGLL